MDDSTTLPHTLPPYVESEENDLSPDYERDDPRQLTAHVLPHVYDWIKFEHVCNGELQHSWPIDPIQGIREIIGFCGVTMGDYEARIIHALRLRDHPDHPAAVGFANAVAEALRFLIAYGAVEVVIEKNWPTLRATLSTLEDTKEYLPGPLADKAGAILARFEELRAMRYAEYLQTPEWKRRRAEHVKAASERCQLCNSDQKPFHVHHRTYENRGYEKATDLVVLCAPCHSAFHKARKVR